VADEVARVAPAQLGANAALLRRARDGVVLPFREHVDEIVLRTRELSILSEDGQGTSWDPIKVEGQAAADIGEDQDPPVVDPEPEVAAANPVPPLLEWDRAAPTVSVPPRDGYALRLVVGRTLYDHGRVVRETPAFGRLVPDNVLRVNPHDLAALGVDSGTEVKITAARASLTRPVVGDPAVPVGVAAIAFPADGTGPALIIDTAAPVTDVRVETLR
jgi:anaerobic selenocysteine-containing dehydrogenase